MELFSHPHRRYNILTGEWVLVSPQRTKRPWKGKVEEQPKAVRPSYDPECYLCPGNLRAGGERNPEYDATFAFANDYPAMRTDTPLDSLAADGLIIAESEQGICRVICYSPRHDLHLAQMPLPGIERIVSVWTDEYRNIGALRNINHVQIFENRGAGMGASSPHPHCQVWANETVPVIPAVETEKQLDHLGKTGECLLCSYLVLEVKLGERIVFENEAFAALVPFWAVWPFETMIVSKRHVSSLPDLNPAEMKALASIMKLLTAGYDDLFETEFPYSMGIHQMPTDGKEHPEWHLHLHYLPPLLRSATVSKFMVGYELLAMPQRDITPESACLTLREKIRSRATDTHAPDARATDMRGGTE